MSMFTKTLCNYDKGSNTYEHTLIAMYIIIYYYHYEICSLYVHNIILMYQISQFSDNHRLVYIRTLVNK